MEGEENVLSEMDIKEESIDLNISTHVGKVEEPEWDLQNQLKQENSNDWQDHTNITNIPSEEGPEFNAIIEIGENKDDTTSCKLPDFIKKVDSLCHTENVKTFSDNRNHPYLQYGQDFPTCTSEINYMKRPLYHQVGQQMPGRPPSLTNFMDYWVKNRIANLQSNSQISANLSDDNVLNPENITNLIGHKEMNISCKLCSITFFDRHALKLHYYRDHSDESKRCKLCPRQFSTLFGLKVHLKSHLGKQPFRCTLCSKLFNKKKAFKKHLFIHHGCNYRIKSPTKPTRKGTKEKKHGRIQYFNKDEMPLSIRVRNIIKCSKCTAWFLTKNNLRIHFRDVHVKKKETSLIIDENFEPSECNYCNKVFYNKSQCNSHVTKHVFVKCKFCDFNIDKIYKYKIGKHINTHIDEKPFICKVCLKEFDYRKDFERHLVAEVKEEKETLFKCDICSLHYYFRTFLTKHLVHYHRPMIGNVDQNKVDEFPYTCEKCQRGFKDEGKFQRHVKLHEYSETCVICKVTYDNAKDFRAHFIDHSNTLRTCPICLKEYPDKVKLKCHLMAEQRRLTKVAAFSCSICNKGFQREAPLKHHIKMFHDRRRIIENAALFRCYFCQKPFVDKYRYVIHMKNHTFFDHCKVCFTEFTVRSQLYKHLEDHLGSAPYICVICRRYFNSRRDLRHHLYEEQGKQSSKRMLECGVCGFHYFHQQYFDKHVRTEHNLNIETEMVLLPESNEDTKVQIKEEVLEFPIKEVLEFPIKEEILEVTIKEEKAE